MFVIWFCILDHIAVYPCCWHPRNELFLGKGGSTSGCLLQRWSRNCGGNGMNKSTKPQFLLVKSKKNIPSQQCCWIWPNSLPSNTKIRSSLLQKTMATCGQECGYLPCKNDTRMLLALPPFIYQFYPIIVLNDWFQTSVPAGSIPHTEDKPTLSRRSSTTTVGWIFAATSTFAINPADPLTCSNPCIGLAFLLTVQNHTF